MYCLCKDDYQPGQPAGLFALRPIGIFIYTSICISVKVFVFYTASCVFVAPKNLLALPPLGGKGEQTCATWFA